jgi:hypothetical protein
MPSNMPAAVPISASVRHLSEPSLGSNGRPACSVSIQDQHAGARQQWTRGHANLRAMTPGRHCEFREPAVLRRRGFPRAARPKHAAPIDLAPKQTGMTALSFRFGRSNVRGWEVVLVQLVADLAPEFPGREAHALVAALSIMFATSMTQDPAQQSDQASILNEIMSRWQPVLPWQLVRRSS